MSFLRGRDIAKAQNIVAKHLEPEQLTEKMNCRQTTHVHLYPLQHAIPSQTWRRQEGLLALPMFFKRLLTPVFWSGQSVLLSCPMNSRLSCSLPHKKNQVLTETLRNEGDSEKSGKSCMCGLLGDGLTTIVTCCVCGGVRESAYVLRLPYALPPVLAVKTLLSISWGGDLFWWQQRDKDHQRVCAHLCVSPSPIIFSSNLIWWIFSVEPL